MIGSIKIKIFFIALFTVSGFLFIPSLVTGKRSELTTYLLGSRLTRETEEDIVEDIPEAAIIVTGDVSYSRGVEWAIDLKEDINYPFEKVKPYFDRADLVWINLETPVTPGARIPDGVMRFRSNPETIQALNNAGVTMVNLANNHTPDFGNKGILDTFKYLEEGNIVYVGAGNNSREAYSPVYQNIKGIRVAFLAYTDGTLVPASYEAGEDQPGTAYLNVEKMTSAVTEAKGKSDIVLVAMHSGIEYVRTPNENQTDFAHAAIDAGADIVIGHHPHVVQSAEIYKDKYIFYSLGNFILDQHFSKETREGIMLELSFNKEQIQHITLRPYFMEAFAQPAVYEKSDLNYWENLLNIKIDQDKLKLVID